MFEVGVGFIEEFEKMTMNKFESFKVSIEVLDTNKYLVGVLLNDYYMIYNYSKEIPYSKALLMEMILNILKMKYHEGLCLNNIDSEDIVYRTIAEYVTQKKSWKCPLEVIVNKVNFLGHDTSKVKNYEDIEDLLQI